MICRMSECQRQVILDLIDAKVAIAVEGENEDTIGALHEAGNNFILYFENSNSGEDAYNHVERS